MSVRNTLRRMNEIFNPLHGAFDNFLRQRFTVRMKKAFYVFMGGALDQVHYSKHAPLMDLIVDVLAARWGVFDYLSGGLTKLARIGLIAGVRLGDFVDQSRWKLGALYPLAKLYAYATLGVAAIMAFPIFVPAFIGSAILAAVFGFIPAVVSHLVCHAFVREQRRSPAYVHVAEANTRSMYDTFSPPIIPSVTVQPSVSVVPVAAPILSIEKVDPIAPPSYPPPGEVSAPSIPNWVDESTSSSSSDSTPAIAVTPTAFQYPSMQAYRGATLATPSISVQPPISATLRNMDVHRDSHLAKVSFLAHNPHPAARVGASYSRPSISVY